MPQHAWRNARVQVRGRGAFVVAKPARGHLPFPTTIAFATFLVGCSSLQPSQISDRRVTLRVADAALAAGAPDVALRVADLTLTRDPHSSQALITKGNALYAMGARDAARAAYREAIAIDPRSAAAQLGLGRTLVQSDPRAAEAAFLAATANEPGNVAALNNLGIVRDLQDDHAEAQDAYRRALAIAPEAADVKVNLGLSLGLSGSRAEAVLVLEEAASDPAILQYRWPELAGALAVAGQNAAARRILASESGSERETSPTNGVVLGQLAHSETNDQIRASDSGSMAASRARPMTKELSPVLPIIHAAGAEDDISPNRLASSGTILAVPVLAVTRTRLAPPPATSRPAIIAGEPPPAHPGTETADLPPSGRSGGFGIAAEPDASDARAFASSASLGSDPAPRTPDAPISPPNPGSHGGKAGAMVSEESVASEGAAYVQLATLHSQEDAWYEWRRLNRRMPDLLQGRTATIVQANAHGQTYWCLRTSGFASLGEAVGMCSQAQGASGLRCWARVTS
jgi:Tfp pilus assembly protein PilF